MNTYKIKWLNTGRVETLKGYNLKNAFNNAGLLIWYKTDKYAVI